MPGFDRTGPLGQGPMTGWGFGLCNPVNRRTLPRQPIYGSEGIGFPWIRGSGIAFGNGRGRGRAFGGRRGRGRAFRTNRGGWFNTSLYQRYNPYLTFY